MNIQISILGDFVTKSNPNDNNNGIGTTIITEQQQQLKNELHFHSFIYPN
jgi:hypothetical protein